MMEQEEHELVMACAPSFCRAAFAASTGIQETQLGGNPRENKLRHTGQPSRAAGATFRASGQEK
jgi:hypothetical protein